MNNRTSLRRLEGAAIARAASRDPRGPEVSTEGRFHVVVWPRGFAHSEGVRRFNTDVEHPLDIADEARRLFGQTARVIRVTDTCPAELRPEFLRQCVAINRTPGLPAHLRFEFTPAQAREIKRLGL